MQSDIPPRKSSNSFQTNICAVLSLTTLWSDGFIVHSSWQQAKSEVTALLPLWQKLAPPWRQCGTWHSATDTYTIHTTCMPKQGPQRGHLSHLFFPDDKPGSTLVEFTVTIADRSSFILPSKFAVQFKHRQYPPIWVPHPSGADTCSSPARSASSF